MTTSVRSTPAAATGALSAVVLTAANGDGTNLSTAQHLAATAALTLLIPFVVYVGALVRVHATSATDTWLSSTAVAAAAVGICMKLLSDAPEIARSDSAVSAGGRTSAALEAVAGATTVLALLPLAAFALATGAAAIRTRALPRWLGAFALVTGVSLAVNGCFLHSENVPALLVFALWCLLASIHLVRASWRGGMTTRAVATSRV